MIAFENERVETSYGSVAAVADLDASDEPIVLLEMETRYTAHGEGIEIPGVELALAAQEYVVRGSVELTIEQARALIERIEQAIGKDRKP